MSMVSPGTGGCIRSAAHDVVQWPRTSPANIQAAAQVGVILVPRLSVTRGRPSVHRDVRVTTKVVNASIGTARARATPTLPYRRAMAGQSGWPGPAWQGHPGCPVSDAPIERGPRSANRAACSTTLICAFLNRCFPVIQPPAARILEFARNAAVAPVACAIASACTTLQLLWFVKPLARAPYPAARPCGR